jgi:hypothetical protein
MYLSPSDLPGHRWVRIHMENLCAEYLGGALSATTEAPLRYYRFITSPDKGK